MDASLFYVVANVWQKIEIQQCRVAPTFMELYHK